MELMQRVTVKMIYSGPFYGHLLMQARKVMDNNMDAPMAVGVIDGMMELRYNRDMLQMILDMYNEDWEYLLGVAEHELLHIIFKHFMRRQDRNAVASIGFRPITVWNMATDIAINQLIDRKLPLNPLRHDDFDMPAGLNAESYYDLLIKQAKANGAYIPVDAFGERMDGKGGGGGDEENDGQDEGEGNGGGWDNEEMRGKGLVDSHDLWRDVSTDADKDNDIENAVVKSAVKKALTHAKRMGKLPSNVEEAINEILKPATIPWNKILRRWVGTFFKVAHSYTWKRPSRRFGETQKGKKPIKSLNIIDVIDTSGSIGTEEFNLFIAETKSIRNSYPCKITIIEADAAVQKVYQLKKEVDVHFKGRGGTDFRPAFDYIDKHNLRPDLVVYLTDMCGTFPSEAPPYPVIWVKTPSHYGWSSKEAPFGMVLEIDDSNGGR
jgi:predicted metal-dependent peptidase